MATVSAASSLLDSTTSTTSAAPAPTDAQQASFQQSMAAAQLGTSAASTKVNPATASKEDVQHLVQFSFFQQTVMNCMAEVERNRQKAGQEED